LIDKRILLAVFASLVLVTSAGDYSEQPRELTVFCAAGLIGPFSETGQMYKNSTGVDVVFSFDGVQSLRTQVENGAYADLFVSSSYKHLNALKAEDLMDNSSISVIAKNRVALIVPKDNPAKIESLYDIARPGIKIVMAAEDVPIGDYTRQVLDNLEKDPAYGPEYKKKVLSNVVSLETNANYIVSKVGLGETDVGFFWQSKSTGDMEKKITRITIPDKYNIIADYNIGILRQSESPVQAKEFINLVKSEKGMALLEKYGFELP